VLGLCLPYTSNPTYQNAWDYLISTWVPDAIWSLRGPFPAPAYREATPVTTAADLPISTAQPLVVVSPVNARYVPGEIPLSRFVHPPDAIYLFGSDHVHLSDDDLGGRVPDYLVYIETLGVVEMFSWVAGGIVFYDRKVKIG